MTYYQFPALFHISVKIKIQKLQACFISKFYNSVVIYLKLHMLPYHKIINQKQHISDSKCAHVSPETELTSVLLSDSGC